VIAALAI